MQLSNHDLDVLRADAYFRRPNGFSDLETKLWNVAASSPYGNKLITANDAKDPYLLRTYLSPDRRTLEKQLVEGLGIENKLVLRAATFARPYLHYFFRGDEDREVHNHPWRLAFSLILAGGYKEYRWLPKRQLFSQRVLSPGNVNLIGKHDFHRVELDQSVGCWTLFLSMDRLEESNGQDWHFLDTTTGEMTPWGEWDARRANNSWRAVGRDRIDHT